MLGPAHSCPEISLVPPRLQHRDTDDTLIGGEEEAGGLDKLPCFQLEHGGQPELEGDFTGSQVKGYYRYLILAACFILNFTGLGIFYGSSVVLAYYTNAGILSSSEASFISSFYIGTALFDPLTTYLTSRFGSRKMLLLGSTCLAIGQLLSSFCTKQPRVLWFTFGLLSGWGGGICNLVAMCLPGKYFRGREGMAMGIVTAGVGAGGCVFGGITQIMLERIGPEWAFRALAFITLLLNVPSALVVRDFQQQEAERERGRATVKAARPALLRDTSADSATTSYDTDATEAKVVEQPQQPSVLCSIISQSRMILATSFPRRLLQCTNFRWLLLATSILAFPIFVVPTFIPAIAGAFDYDISFATWMVVVFNVSATVSKLGQSWLCDHVRPTAVLSGALIGSALLCGICFTLLKYTAGFAILVVLSGLTTGGIYSVLTLVVTQSFTQDDAMGGTGMLECLSAIGYIFGPAIAGAISDKTYDYSGKAPFNGGAIWTGGMFLISGMIMLKLWWQGRRPLRTVPAVHIG